MSAIERSLPVSSQRPQPDVLPGLGPPHVRVVAPAQKPLVTLPTIRYRHAHGDARRGFRDGAGADRVGRGDLVAPHVCAAERAERLAGPRGDGTDAGGCGGSTRGRAALGGSRRPQRCRLVEVAVQVLPAEAERGRAGDQGASPRGQGHAVLAGQGGAPGGVALRSSQRVERVRHDRSVGRRGRAAAKGPDIENPEGRDRAAVEGERAAAQGPGAIAGAEGRDRGVARRSLGAAQVGASRADGAVEGEHPAGQGAGTDAEAEGHNQGAARGSRLPDPRGPLAEPRQRPAATRAGVDAEPQGDDTPAVRRGQAAARGAGGIPRPERLHRLAVGANRRSASRPVDIGLREAGVGGRACRSSAAARGRQETARAGGDHRVPADPGPDAGRGPGQAALEPGRPVEGAPRQEERAAEEARYGAQARPAARRARPRPHPAAQAPGEDRTAQPAEGCAHLFLLRQALCRQRRALHEPDRDRGQGPHPQDRAPALAPGLRVCVLAPGSDSAAGAAAVPRNALRNQLLGTVPVRTLCVPAPAVPGRGVVCGPGAAGLAGHAGQQPEALRGAVRPALRGDPRAPEHRGAASCRRDRLAGAGVPRHRPVEPRLAVGLGQQRFGLLHHRPLAQRRGRKGPVPRHRLHRLPGLRPLQRLPDAGARARRQGDPLLVPSRRGRCRAPPLADPDEQISRIRFLTCQFRLRGRTTYERAGPAAAGAGRGLPPSGPR